MRRVEERRQGGEERMEGGKKELKSRRDEMGGVDFMVWEWESRKEANGAKGP